MEILESLKITENTKKKQLASSKKNRKKNNKIRNEHKNSAEKLLHEMKGFWSSE